jgi:hypothetical protein
VPVPARGVLTIYSSDEDHVVASWNPLIFACFTRPPSPSALACIRQLADDGLREGIRGGIFYVVARKEMAGGVDPRVRAFFDDMTRRNSDRTGASAAVLLTAGFSNALIRSFLVGIAQALISNKKLQIFSDVHGAARWIAPLHDLEAAGLEKAFRRATGHLAMPDTPNADEAARGR